MSGDDILKWLKIAGYPACIVGGLLFGLYGSDSLYHPGCTFTASFTSGVSTTCPNPYEAPLSFGQKPSPRSLSDSLKIVQETTQGMGQARINIRDDILKADFAKTIVHPPSGSQGSLAVVRQLVDEAQASRMVDVCLEPTQGFVVQLSKSAPSSGP